jgi:lysophospholipase L1-like esterase
MRLKKTFAAAVAIAALASSTFTGIAANAARKAVIPPVTGTWEAAMLNPTELSPDGSAHATAYKGFDDQTLREIVHVSAGSTNQTRIRISNVYGTGPITVTEATVGIQESGPSIAPGTLHVLTFGGSRSVTIAKGTRVTSDWFPNIQARENLSISLFFQGKTGPATVHPVSIQTTYLASGNHATGTTGTGYRAMSDQSWFFVDGVAVRNSNLAGAIVCFGPSTTDGFGSTDDANERYPDDLAAATLTLPQGQRLAVLNAGQSGNRLLADTTAGYSGLHRFQWDVLSNSDVKYVVVWEGLNDIEGASAKELASGDLYKAITHAYQQLIGIAHSKGLKIIGATLQPAGCAKGSSRETTREAVNNWIRAPGDFDNFIDFDKVLRVGPDHDNIMNPKLQYKGIHPNDKGYLAIAKALASKMKWVG